MFVTDYCVCEKQVNHSSAIVIHSRRLLLSRVLAAGAVPLEAIKGRQRLVLRNRCCLGCLSRGMGDTALHFDVAYAQESHVGGAHADPWDSVPGHGCYFRGTWIPLRVRKDYCVGHLVDCVRASVCQFGDPVGGPTEGYAE